MLYWTDWSTTSPGIYRSSVVNPAREMLVNGSITWPNALAIDFTGNQSHDKGILRTVVIVSIKVKISTLVTTQQASGPRNLASKPRNIALSCSGNALRYIKPFWLGSRA